MRTPKSSSFGVVDGRSRARLRVARPREQFSAASAPPRDTPSALERPTVSVAARPEVGRAKLFFPEEYPDLIADELRGLWGVR
jgi:hypothetical protein